MLTCQWCTWRRYVFRQDEDWLWAATVVCYVGRGHFCICTLHAKVQMVIRKYHRNEIVPIQFCRIPAATISLQLSLFQKFPNSEALSLKNSWKLTVDIEGKRPSWHDIWPPPTNKQTNPRIVKAQWAFTSRYGCHMVNPCSEKNGFKV